MKVFLKIILLPITLIYALVTQFRNLFYKWGIFSSTSYDFPVIVVGNLSVGGTGKTPHTEFILDFLQSKYQLASLSRGYGRETKGFRIANSKDNPQSIGDEPFQIFTKFQNITVAVDESRRRGIENLRALATPPEVIILDDAFQHRSVKAGLNILLTDFSNLYVNDLPLPSGRLREPQSGAERADIIIVTKCPDELNISKQKEIIKLLKPKASQKVYFSFISYKELKPLNQAAANISNPTEYLKASSIFLLSAIANPLPMINELKKYNQDIVSFDYRDHYYFQEKDYEKIKSKIAEAKKDKKVIICSEKDAVKINSQAFLDIPLFVLPIKIDFHNNENQAFKKDIQNFIDIHY